ncbi:uncharacterized protein LOC111084913 isoform X2 [Limulus polyphemus]|uniref:Uncharacterized protein LOC111084913 isoform X2 n=1 Tax=Limulus polyphemus TaxID=6850 RepID=A0ABM1S0P1_LIMPO|nr:uncharacterized protein LOC111084913 isoform X2 [Limulus polyphemus]
MDPENNGYIDLNPYWSGEDEQYDNCDCPRPPPPQFLIPPPPASPSFQLCQGQNSDLQYCDVRPLGAEYTHPTFPSLPVIAVCSSVVFVAILVVSFLLWKHKRKVQNFLPSKSEHQPPCDIPSSNGVTYDDVLISHHPTRIPTHHHVGPNTQTLTPIELLDVKYGAFSQPQFSHTNFTFSSKQMGSLRSNKSKEHFNPIYEEVSGGSEEKGDTRSGDSDIEDSETEARVIGSEDEFAEDELSLAEFPKEAALVDSTTSSLRGSTGGDLCPDVASGSSEGALTDISDSRELRGLFRGNKGGSLTHKNVGQSSERIRNKHGNGRSQPKHHYYLDKNMRGKDQSYPTLQRGGDAPIPQNNINSATHLDKPGISSNIKVSSHEPEYLLSGHREIYSDHPNERRSHKRHTDSPAPLPNPFGQDSEQASVMYSPTSGSKAGGLPGAVLSELNQRISDPNKRPGLNSDSQSRKSPMPSKQRSIAPVELETFRAKPGLRSIPNPQKDNIYASIDEEEPYTNDGNCQHTSRNPGESRHSLSRRGVPKGWNKALTSQYIPPIHNTEEQESYGNIRPVNDSRTIGT